MADKNEKGADQVDNIQLYSDEVVEIMGHTPSRFIRYGIIVFSMIIISIIALSFIFKYPETLKGTYTIQTSNPPVSMLAQSSGKMKHLLVRDGDFVQKGQLLAMIESPTNLDSYLQLKSIIIPKALTIDSIPEINSLGNIQSAYSDFTNAIMQFRNYQTIGTIDSKIINLEKKLTEISKQIKIGVSQNNSIAQKLKIIKNEYYDDSVLHSRGVIASVELQDKKKTLIEEELSYNSSKLDFSNLAISLTNLQSQIIELNLEKTEEIEKLKLNITDKKAYLNGILSDWEQRHCLISPISGNISLSNVWFENQNVIIGQKVMTVLPNDSLV